MKKEEFQYLGRTFKPIRRMLTKELNNLSRHAGNKIDVPGYSHRDFYIAVHKVNAGKYDIFELDGREVIPMGGWLSEWVN